MADGGVRDGDAKKSHIARIHVYNTDGLKGLIYDRGEEARGRRKKERQYVTFFGKRKEEKGVQVHTMAA